MKGEPRLNHNASQEAIHEAGHTLERYLLHGTTGSILPEPLPGKQAGAESEPLPDCLREPNPNKPEAERVVAGPYTEKQRARLEQEIKRTTTSTTRSANWGRESCTRTPNSSFRSTAVRRARCSSSSRLLNLTVVSDEVH